MRFVSLDDLDLSASGACVSLDLSAAGSGDVAESFAPHSLDIDLGLFDGILDPVLKTLTRPQATPRELTVEAVNST